MMIETVIQMENLFSSILPFHRITTNLITENANSPMLRIVRIIK